MKTRKIDIVKEARELRDSLTPNMHMIASCYAATGLIRAAASREGREK